MKVTILYFAVSREAVGKSQDDVELADDCTSHSLLQLLTATYPRLESVMKSCVFAINQEYVPLSENMALKDGDEIAIIPPLSGG